MAQLEIITLQFRGEPKVNLSRLLFEELSVQNLLKEKVKKLSVFRRAKGIAEMSIALFWEAEQCVGEGSALGLRLSAALEEFGFVSHSVWEEIVAPE